VTQRPAIRARIRRGLFLGALACGLAAAAMVFVAVMLAGPRHVRDLIPDRDEAPEFLSASFDEEEAIFTEAQPRREDLVSGAAYDVARLPIPAIRRLVVPAGTRVESGDADELLVYMKKSVGSAGYPPKPITPLVARRAMGCAWRRAGDTLELGPYGDWSNIEGRASIRVLVVVPRRVEVSVTGVAGAAQLDEPGWWLRHRENDPGYWYAASVPADGWKALISEPDPSRGAD
jgi:hypothetical protein